MIPVTCKKKQFILTIGDTIVLRDGEYQIITRRNRDNLKKQTESKHKHPIITKTIMNQLLNAKKLVKYKTAANGEEYFKVNTIA